MTSKKSNPSRERVVMNEKGGHGHVDRLPSEQVKHLSDSTPDWLTRCRTTRTTDTEGSQA